MLGMLGDRLSYATQIAQGTVAVWFVCWALRRKYELDEKLDRREQSVRWIVVSIAFGMTMLSGSRLAAARVTAWVLGTAFLAWPNLAHGATTLVDRLIRPKRSSDAL